ncbi:protease pro-enzyme activation domain-containing protein [Sulfuracidifex metallicus]|uniref:S8 family serine peptidase n=2 Tax=Sulfuracidifex metallicus TaxID=47303 RepID=A0A6A9QJG8_SULME|nr:protease pro-enzyme activation domain-containing protein [Sulfuracidifex metallicus]MUN28390.1 S8 family serine peptidase [Sulfuracidifex metallicus DSM 6482 = JCM 9184]WOE51091.1 protease pro-enzyme activation domain-containing protein [Sulfuracidifex metallicus DSM 6482 = JCM 9184]
MEDTKNFGVLLLTIILITIGSSMTISASNVPTSSPMELQNPETPQINGFHYEGKLDPSTNVVVTFSIPLRNLNMLYYYAEETSNPSSSLYHHFLSKEQVEKLFYPSSSYQKLMSWINEEGLKVISTSTDSVVVVEGKASQFEKLGLSFSVFSNGSESYYIANGQFNLPVHAFIYSSNISNLFFGHPSTLFNKARSFGVNSTTPIEAYPIKALREAYNVTPLYSNNVKGSSNYSIGILDFYGDPYINQELAYYDQLYNISNPPYFKIVPIGPYDPNLGIETGWAGEISLDVESSHTIAPNAGITLFIANGNLPLYSIISYIDEIGNVTDVSQSFSIPETYFSQFSGPQFYSCVVLTDQYYAMGSAEGITFLASSGDAGGSGYSAGPLGTVGYPATSPWVTAMGGTTTYIDFGKGFVTTSWSNYGFIPNGVNYGGSTGGISIIEPEPWYQEGLSAPSSYPDGREVPDLSANANVYPGVYIVCPGNVTEISGGTSEASPLMAGMVALMAQYLGHKLGDLNPIIYELADNSTDYQKAFVPITFGYNIPWTAHYGYNLVNGWGSINLGYLSNLVKELSVKPSLSVSIKVLNGTPNVTLPEEIYPGQNLTVVANVTYNGTPVKANVTLYLSDVMGQVLKAEMTKMNGSYYALVKVPSNDSGITYFTVNATYMNQSKIEGVGMVSSFAGYYICFLSPIIMKPYSVENNVTVEAQVENVYGEPFPHSHVEVAVYYYNFTSNQYIKVGNVTLTFNNYTDLWTGYLQGNYNAGVMLLMGENAYGFVSFYNGFDLQSLFILPQVISEPGAVGGGQYVIIQGNIEPPVNIPPSTMSDSVFGTTINASLTFNGKSVSSTQLLMTSQLQYLGFLYVPKNVSGGLYNIILNAQYQSFSLGENISGYFYGQIYVSPSVSTPVVETSNYSIQGQLLEIYANISYPNGTPVRFGMYSATVFPVKLSFDYSYISNLVEIPLYFNYTSDLWQGNVTLPSILNDGNLSYLDNSVVQGPFRILVTGESYNAVPTNVSLKYAKTINVEPFSLIESQKITEPTDNSYFKNDTILDFSGELMNDVFYNTTVEGGTQDILMATGSMSLMDANSTIIQGNLNDVYAYDSHLTLIDSHIEELKLVNSTVTLIDSNVSSISPSAPEIVTTKYINATYNASLTFNVIGENIKQVVVTLNGTPIGEFYTNGTHSVTINTTKLPDGTYSLEIRATQSDGISSTYTTLLNVNGQLENLNKNLGNLSTQFSNKTSSIDSALSSQSKEEGKIMTYADVGIVLAIIALIIAIVALIRRSKST